MHRMRKTALLSACFANGIIIYREQTFANITLQKRVPTSEVNGTQHQINSSNNNLFFSINPSSTPGLPSKAARTFSAQLSHVICTANSSCGGQMSLNTCYIWMTHEWPLLSLWRFYLSPFFSNNAGRV